MNYSGRIIGENFNSDFLKEALLHNTEGMPYRGPELFSRGDYHYHCRVLGEFVWFQGYEEIFHLEEKIYEGHFIGGVIK